jgi:uncharacterized membrane protein
MEIEINYQFLILDLCLVDLVAAIVTRVIVHLTTAQTTLELADTEEVSVGVILELADTEVVLAGVILVLAAVAAMAEAVMAQTSLDQVMAAMEVTMDLILTLATTTKTIKAVETWAMVITLMSLKTVTPNPKVFLRVIVAIIKKW